MNYGFSGYYWTSTLESKFNAYYYIIASAGRSPMDGYLEWDYNVRLMTSF